MVVGGRLGLTGAGCFWWTGPGEVHRHVCKHQHKLSSGLRSLKLGFFPPAIFYNICCLCASPRQSGTLCLQPPNSNDLLFASSRCCSSSIRASCSSSHIVANVCCGLKKTPTTNPLNFQSFGLNIGNRISKRARLMLRLPSQVFRN